MNPIELISVVGRVAGVAAALAIVGWFTTRRVAKQGGAPGADPIRQYLDRNAATRTESEKTS